MLLWNWKAEVMAAAFPLGSVELMVLLKTVLRRIRTMPIFLVLDQLWGSFGSLGGKPSVFACEVDSGLDCLSCSQFVEEGPVNIIHLVVLGSSSEGNVHGITSYLF